MAQLDATTGAMLAGAGLAVLGMVKLASYFLPFVDDFFGNKQRRKSSIDQSGHPAVLRAILHEVPEAFAERVSVIEREQKSTRLELAAININLNAINMNLAVLRDRSDQIQKNHGHT